MSFLLLAFLPLERTIGTSHGTRVENELLIDFTCNLVMSMSTDEDICVQFSQMVQQSLLVSPRHYLYNSKEDSFFMSLFIQNIPSVHELKRSWSFQWLPPYSLDNQHSFWIFENCYIESILSKELKYLIKIALNNVALVWNRLNPIIGISRANISSAKNVLDFIRKLIDEFKLINKPFQWKNEIGIQSAPWIARGCLLHA